MAASSEQKTEKPTEKRLREARRRGQVAKSAELAGALALLAALITVLSLLPWAAHQVADLWQASLRLSEVAAQPTLVVYTRALVVEALQMLFMLSLAPLGVAALVGTTALALQVGGVFSFESIQPKLERLNPAEGLKRVLSMRTLVKLAQMVLKLGIVGGALALVLLMVLPDAIRVTHADAGAALQVARSAMTYMLLWCGGLFLLIGFADFAYQRWQYLRDMRMSLTEVRRERRDSEGDAKMKGERKRRANEATPQEQLRYVQAAHLVVHDGGGRAIALALRPDIHELPITLVRGSDAFGVQVLARARKQQIKVVLDAILVDRLFAGAQLAQPVPAHDAPQVLAHMNAPVSPKA
jgi:type III secretion protein U